MKWREKLNKMAMIDILYMLSDNTVCLKVLFMDDTGPCDMDCHKCMERFLNEEVSREGVQNDNS